eukprot:13845810-Ditylum_brightwellii.AAC.1
MEAQNYFLDNQISAVVAEFSDIEVEVPDPYVLPDDDLCMEGLHPLMVPLFNWILQKRVVDGGELITSIEQGP